MPLQAGRAMKSCLCIAMYFVTIGLWVGVARSAELPAMRPSLRITVVYNNLTYARNLVSAWGFAAVVETDNGTLLFDTGGDGPTLMGNLRRLGIDPAAIDAVVLSHSHGDHTGGLDDFLARHTNVTVYLPRSFPISFHHMVEQYGGNVKTVSEPQCLFGNFHSTGEMGNAIKEQALIIDTGQGPVIVTGCAHPGIVEIVQTARKYLNKKVHLLMGGFHLQGMNAAKLHSILQTLRDLGVHRVAPSHCTGDVATAMFRDRWESDFIRSGCGAVIEIP